MQWSRCNTQRWLLGSPQGKRISDVLQTDGCNAFLRYNQQVNQKQRILLNASWQIYKTSMHSSMMRTARSLPYGGLPDKELSRQKIPPGQRPPGQRPPWTETIWIETPWSGSKWHHTETPVNRQTPVKHYLVSNFAGGKNSFTKHVKHYSDFLSDRSVNTIKLFAITKKLSIIAMLASKDSTTAKNYLQ